VKALSLAFLLAAAPPLAAQQSLVSRTLDSATTVRLHLVSGPVVHGVLLAPLGPDAIAIAFAPPTHRDCGVPRAICRLELPVRDVQAVEIQRGWHAGRGALIGALIGAATGFVFGSGVTQYAPCPLAVPGGSCSSGPSDAAVIATTTLLGGALGAGIGALFGLGSPAWGRAP
jgi:hypothetical protein